MSCWLQCKMGYSSKSGMKILTKPYLWYYGTQQLLRCVISTLIGEVFAHKNPVYDC